VYDVDKDTIYWIGGLDSLGYYAHPQIWALELMDDGASLNMTETSRMPSARYDAASIWDDVNKHAYTFGGYNGSSSFNAILRFSPLDNTTVEMSATLPSNRHLTSAVWDPRTEVAYIFGGRTGSSGGYLNDILRWDSKSDALTKLNVSLPVQIAFTSAVWAGEEAWIVGGFSNVANNWPAVVRFNPATNQVTSFQVEGLPDKLYATAAVYVERLTRIYIFGGYGDGAYRQDIWYIDLDMNDIPTTTTSVSTTTATTITTSGLPDRTTTTTRKPGYPPVDCGDKEDGALLPNPYCCESYYQCDSNSAVLQKCPSILHFNPRTLLCDYPELVGCRVGYYDV